MLLDIFLRGLLVLIFISGTVVISFFTTRALAFFIPSPVVSGIFLASTTVILSAVVIIGVAYFYVYHGFGAQSDVIRRIPTSRKKVVLTFDDGPSQEYTPKILDILAEKGVRATFFMVGSNVENYSEVARRIVEEGHEVGNHTYGHITVPHAPPPQLASQIMRTNWTILQHTGKYPPYLRPPRGLYDMRLRRLVKLTGQELVLWSLSSQDWHPRANGENIAKRLLSSVSPGDILLFHDSGSLLKTEGSNRNPTIEAVSLLIDGLHRQGYQIVPLEDYVSPLLLHEKKM